MIEFTCGRVRLRSSSKECRLSRRIASWPMRSLSIFAILYWVRLRCGANNARKNEFHAGRLQTALNNSAGDSVCRTNPGKSPSSSSTEVQRLSFPPCFYKGSWLQSTCPDRAVNKQQIQCTQATALKGYYSNKESCTVAGGPRQKQGVKDTSCTSVVSQPRKHH